MAARVTPVHETLPPVPSTESADSRPRVAAAKLPPEERRAEFRAALRANLERNRAVYASLAKR